MIKIKYVVDSENKDDSKEGSSPCYLPIKIGEFTRSPEDNSMQFLKCKYFFNFKYVFESKSRWLDIRHSLRPTWPMKKISNIGMLLFNLDYFMNLLL